MRWAVLVAAHLGLVHWLAGNPAPLSVPDTTPSVVVWAGAAALPLVAGVVQLAKNAGFPQRWAGFLAMGVALTGSVYFGHVTGVDSATSIVQGLLVGLAASGAWSTGKNTIGAALRRRGEKGQGRPGGDGGG